MKEIIQKLRNSWNEQGGLSIAQRRAKLLSLKKAVETHEMDIVRALKADLGKPQFEVYTSEIGSVLGEIKNTLKNLTLWTKIQKVKTPLVLMPARSFILPEPRGLVLIFSPWNYPFQLCLSPLVAALAAGNRVVLKPSEISVETTKVLRRIVEAVFNDTEVLFLEGGPREAQAILLEKFDYIFFTGSTQVGRLVMKAAAEYLTPLTLELGGKSPLIVDHTANIDIAAKRCVWGKFMNAGQTCVAPDYVLVSKEKEHAFIERVKHHIEQFYGQNPESSDDYGRIISMGHLERLMGLIQKDKVVVGGKIDKERRYLSPTVLKDISWKDKIMEEEIFGPILPIIPYSDFSQMISRIKSRPHPLALYLFSENKKNIDTVLRQVSFGGGCINDVVVQLANQRLPFGGIGESGMGSYHGKKSFDTFTHFKSILKNTTALDIPLRYPPYKKKLTLIKRFV